MNYLMKTKWLPVILVVLVLMNIITISAFWLFNNPPKGGAITFLVTELAFDSLQRQQLNLFTEEHRSETRDIRKLNRDAKNAFFDLLKETNVSDSVLETAARRSVYYDAEMVKSTFRHFKKIRSICTPAQREKFDQIIHDVLRMQAEKPGPPPHNGERPMHPGPDMPPPQH